MEDRVECLEKICYCSIEIQNYLNYYIIVNLSILKVLLNKSPNYFIDFWQIEFSTLESYQSPWST